MGGPAYIVLPVSDGDTNYHGQETSEIIAAIQEVLHKRTHPEEYIEPEHIGPLKQIIENKDSLSKYISWEDPVRTLGAYIGALGVLFGAHYLPLTQVILKIGLTTFGLVSVVEFASRALSQNSISTRFRPEEYKEVPEPILNDTLNDVHDLIQRAVVHAQRIIYGQDLEKTFAAFLAFTVLYWLAQLVSPFWLAVLALTTVFLAPLVASPRGRAAARDANVRAQELANAAVENSKGLAQNGKGMATELSSKARQAAVDTKDHVQYLAQSGKQAAANGSAHASDIASDIADPARDRASNIANSAAENARNVPEIGSNTLDKAQDTASSAVGDAKKYSKRPLSSEINSNSSEDHSITGQAVNEASRLSTRAAETAKHMTPEGFYNQTTSGSYGHGSSVNDTDRFARPTAPNSTAERPTSTYMEPTPLSADLIGTEKTGSAADTMAIYADAGDVNGSHAIMNRPRGL
ncbi:hypothetical protein LTR47_011573 [Exophiala xenobiotica]|nr:hypothetical protein LTR92_011372 [Exophiala xenobiotica]KAK5219281.1 hypothetical protein LTR47_011573 [Exophiala xenobiotica]KAK5281835.1 hypothetical protein LTR40_004213 [Exophiala xenobiotica]KAK5344724.1 hypothetical protein LTR61_011505 [Exophiala xenobiotica]KAK5357243.1 hypothetical protein LTR11_011519 [Exophiala xenobiotica]